MYFFKSYEFNECFKYLSPIMKNKTIRKINQLDKSFSTVIMRPLKNRPDTYIIRIDNDCSIFLLLDGQFCMLLFVGKDSDFTG